MWGALGMLGYRLGWQAHSQRGQKALVDAAQGLLQSARSHVGSCTQGQATSGELAGILVMPTLDVQAPIEEGVDDAVLNVAVGHAPGTPQPGEQGTSVLLAHDVSYFARIDELKPGEEVDVEWPCVTDQFRVTGHQVVQAGAPVPQQAGASLVLDTCWPTNALWYTPQRYLVMLSESGIETGKHGQTGAQQAQPAVNYTTPAPPELVAQGIDLGHNEAPMGTMQFGGSPSAAWAQSPAPLSVEAAALDTYFGALHSAAQKRSDWWSVLAPGVSAPPQVWGAWISGHNAPLDVTISAANNTPQSVELDTTVTFSGGSAPGEYRQKVIETVHGTDLVVTSWEVQHA